MAQVRALAEATQRSKGRAQALQAVALRAAAWGEAEDFGRLVDQLNGVTPREAADAGELEAALAGFGLRLGG